MFITICTRSLFEKMIPSNVLKYIDTMTLLCHKPDLGSNCTGESKMENETTIINCITNNRLMWWIEVCKTHV